jgi:hypothetical protein
MDKGYVPFDEIDPRDSDSIRLFQSKAQKEAILKKQTVNALYSILNTPSGEKLINYWMETYVHTFIAKPNDTQVAIGIKQGQANFVMHIKQTIEQLKQGVEDGR